MLSIFAIDPQICKNLEWFRYCTEHCQPSLGRAIADLPPGEWLRKSLDYINVLVGDGEMGPVKGQSLKRRMDGVRDRLIDRPGTYWDYMEERWIANAENEHRREPFAAVVSPDYDDADATDHQYHPNELNETASDWNTQTGKEIKRTRGQFVDAVMPVLEVASDIQFLDRGFGVDSNSLYTWNYRRIIQRLAASSDTFPAITVHCCPRDAVSTDYFRTELESIYAQHIPAGKTLKCVIWQALGDLSGGRHPFHNRYVLTEYCGLMVGYGTDSTRESTDVLDTIQFIGAKLHGDLLARSKKRSHPLVSVRKGGEITIVGVAT